MKRNLLLVAAIFAFAAAASAQDATGAATVPNFGGSWTLDVSKSKLSDRGNIQAQVMTVTQSDTKLKVATATKAKNPQPTEVSLPGTLGGGLGRRDMPVTYTLNKETETMEDTPAGPSPVKLSSKIDGNKLYLTHTTTMSAKMGRVRLTRKETWELSGDGSTLTVTTEHEGMTTTRIFTKKT